MTGFKSFAEQAEVEIESGMTGIVGPNGCGKSNIVEGLRWVMGESNARQMRGSEMDDVIFSGTEQRPARNLAEITLHLDNRDRTAPSEFNDEDEIEITRRIERGKGSNYLVNSKPARAKDVQLLFADSATGARSSGIVSQGRIGAIVGARPVDRRALLEEAANIRGLIRELDRRYPGLGEQVDESMAVAIDGVICQDTYLEPIGPDSEVCRGVREFVECFFSRGAVQRRHHTAPVRRRPSRRRRQHAQHHACD